MVDFNVYSGSKKKKVYDATLTICVQPQQLTDIKTAVVMGRRLKGAVVTL